MSELINVPRLEPHIIELLRRAATDLPADLEARLGSEGARAAHVRQARARSQRLVEETGVAHFWVRYPAGPNEHAITTALRAAFLAATERDLLGPTAIDVLSGHAESTNLGEGVPQIHLRQWDRPVVKVDVLLSCGACDEAGGQRAFVVGDGQEAAALEGAQRAAVELIDAALRRAPRGGVCGVVLGGDRAAGMLAAKEQLLRRVGDQNPDPRLSRLEATLLRDAAALRTAKTEEGPPVVAVKVAALHRPPTSYVVSLAYECWACRRQSVEIDVLRNEATFGVETFVARQYGRHVEAH